ncbi:hypothetical protein GOP47_0009513 [Adiantum capillus-veneris]|uniref:Major facilitator superfamily (MFS) profile domain-containing protein n=1 Tax=Adiantum capillus-veneris TaxID=13818 RepID=A0A9D4UX86_ADICA|nr:hypothetical protein GOP47_0009513 [Adiantum capillus-veneris]
MAEHVSVATPLLPECSQKESKAQRLSIDEVLQEWAGELGPGQVRHFILVSLAWWLPCFLTFVMVFADQTPEWVCTPTLHSNIAITFPAGNSSLLPHLHEPHVAAHMQSNSPSCTPTSSICSLASSLWKWVDGEDASTVSQWGLICGNSYKVGLVQCLFFLGISIGSGVWGGLSDSSLGRKGVLILTCCLSSILCLVTAFSPNYWVYIALRLATGLSAGGIGTTAFVLATEVVGPSKRGPASMSIFFSYACAIIILSTLALFTSPWRLLYKLSSALCSLYCLLVLPFVQESPRWYLARGEVDKALNILKDIASRNKRSIPETITLEREKGDALQAIAAGVRKAGPLDIFKIPVARRRMVIMLFIWLTNGLSYFGINLNVSNVGENISIGLILNAVVEMPSYLIAAFMLQAYGRRPVLVCALLLSGVSCLGGALAGGSATRMICGMVAIFGIAASYNMVFIYTAELFPTEVRNVAIGLASQAAQIGAVSAPLAAAAAKIHGCIPFAVFSSMAFIASCVASCLPETLEKRMHETMHGMLV